MRNIPRYSREDMADAVRHATEMADLFDAGSRPSVGLLVNRMRVWAAMLSEAANRTPTHRELVAMIDATPTQEGA